MLSRRVFARRSIVLGLVAAATYTPSLTSQEPSGPGTLVSLDNIERYTKLGVRAVMTSFFPWIQASTKTLLERAAAGAKG